MTILLLVVGVCFVLILLGVPIAFAFGGGLLALVLLFQEDFFIIVPVGFGIMTSYGLLAVPLFIYAGVLLGESGIADRLLAFINSIIGPVRGSLGAVVVVTCAIFGAMSGSCSAACATIGTIMHPRMVKEGYPSGYVVGLVANACLIAVFIPPSCIAIVYASVTKLPVTALFLTTLVPGIIDTILFIGVNYILTRKSRMPGLKVAPKISPGVQLKEITRTGRGAILALLAPVFVLGAIYGGFTTPTEAAGIMVVYSLILGFLVYRELSWKKLMLATAHTASLVGTVMILVFSIYTLSGIMVRQDLPQYLMVGFSAITQNKYVFLLIVNILLLFLGLLMDDTSSAILSGVILAPIATKFGIDPYHFAAIVLINTTMGLVTPPVSSILYLAARVCNNPPFDEFIKPTMWFLVLGHVPVLLMTTYFPQLALWIPTLWSKTM